MGCSFERQKGIIITLDFQEISDKSSRTLNKIWIDKCREFYNRSMKSWLRDNDIEMHIAHNEGNSVVAERFIRTLKK